MPIDCIASIVSPASSPAPLRQSHPRSPATLLIALQLPPRLSASQAKYLSDLVVWPGVSTSTLPAPGPRWVPPP